MKTSELTGAALDWAVAKCEGLPVEKNKGGSISFDAGLFPTFSDLEKGRWQIWSPSFNWAQGGPIIEREMIQLTPKCMVNPLHGWAAAYRSFDEEDDVYALHRRRGKTPLIAAMRCYVASKLGDEVEIPEELTC